MMYILRHFCTKSGKTCISWLMSIIIRIFSQNIRKLDFTGHVLLNCNQLLRCLNINVVSWSPLILGYITKCYTITWQKSLLKVRLLFDWYHSHWIDWNQLQKISHCVLVSKQKHVLRWNGKWNCISKGCSVGWLVGIYI